MKTRKLSKLTKMIPPPLVFRNESVRITMSYESACYFFFLHKMLLKVGRLKKTRIICKKKPSSQNIAILLQNLRYGRIDLQTHLKSRIVRTFSVGITTMSCFMHANHNHLNRNVLQTVCAH